MGEDHNLESFQEGRLLLIDKPEGWTSFDAVKKVRVTAKVKKVGHAGTLDPLATGLLLICTGKFTKRIQELTGLEKEYTGTICLGAITDSYDRETEIREPKDISGISESDIREGMKQLTGAIAQIPPVFSAVKVDGQRAYSKARKGEAVKIEPRQIIIEQFDLISYEAPIVRFRVRCSKGTYIRSLAHDLGNILGCGAYLDSLRRTAIGTYRVEDATDIVAWADGIRRLRNFGETEQMSGEEQAQRPV
ncbi:MAG: tRNA pseudouridine(55) synthase TruB [Flavobacteriales bacterium]|nr:tRNA pseudouridine(55) synthase TruB [Flavobacteriales bacterium]